MKFLSYVILPNKSEEIHTVMAHFAYQKDFKYGAHLLKYFRHPLQFDFVTMSEVSFANLDDLLLTDAAEAGMMMAGETE